MKRNEDVTAAAFYFFFNRSLELSKKKSDSDADTLKLRTPKLAQRSILKRILA